MLSWNYFYFLANLKKFSNSIAVIFWDCLGIGWNHTEKSSLKFPPGFISLAERGMRLGSSVFKLQEIRMWEWAKTLLVATWWGDLFVEWDGQLYWNLGDLSPRHCAIMVDMCKKINEKLGLTEWSVKEGTQRPCPSGLTFRLKVGRVECTICICLRVLLGHTEIWFFSDLNSLTWNVNKNV